MDDSLGSAEFSTDDSGDTDFNVTMSAVNEEAEEGEEGDDRSGLVLLRGYPFIHS